MSAQPNDLFVLEDLEDASQTDKVRNAISLRLTPRPTGSRLSWNLDRGERTRFKLGQRSSSEIFTS